MTRPTLAFNPADLAPLILPAAFIAFCILYYGGLWWYRIRFRGRRMAKVAAALGGTYRAGADDAATRATPQFDSTQLRLRRIAYNIVRLEWAIQGQRCPVWMGDVGNQPLSDVLVKAVGGEIMAGFIAVELPAGSTRNMIILDRRSRMREQLSRARFRRGGIAINLWEKLQDWSERSGLISCKAGVSAFDERFAVCAESQRASDSVLNESTIRMFLDSHPGHIWIKDGILVLEAGDYIWSASDFIDRAEWLRDFLDSWERRDTPLSPELSSEPHRLL